MSRLCAGSFAVSVLLGLVTQLTASSSKVVQPTVTLEVRVYNYAEVPSDTLAQAQDFAGAAFQQIGLVTEWIEPLKMITYQSGKEPKERPKYALRIVPNSMIGSWAGGRDLLGFSLVPADGGMGSLGGAYYERIVELSRRLGGDPAVTLGYVLAHELGHLVLGAQSHSYSGIMSHPFEGRHLRLASQGRLGFTSAQAKRFREQLRPRR